MKKYMTPDFELNLLPMTDVLFISAGKEDNSMIEDDYDVIIGG